MSRTIWWAITKSDGLIEVQIEGERAVGHVYSDQSRSQPPAEISGEDIITAANAILTEHRAIELLLPQGNHRHRLPDTALERTLTSLLSQLSPDDHKAQSAISSWVSFICKGPHSSFHGMIGGTVRRDNPHLADLISAIGAKGDLIRETVKRQRVLLQDAAGVDPVETYGWEEEIAAHPRRAAIAAALRETGRFEHQEPLVRKIARALTGGAYGTVSWKEGDEVGAFLKQNPWAQDAVTRALSEQEDEGGDVGD